MMDFNYKIYLAIAQLLRILWQEESDDLDGILTEY